MIDLEAIKARCEAAVPPPWVNTGGRYPKINGGPSGGCEVATLFFANDLDADFIAHAREDIPALVAEVERLQDTLRALYGTVSIKPTWERQWPHVNALVREVLGRE